VLGCASSAADNAGRCLGVPGRGDSEASTGAATPSYARVFGESGTARTLQGLTFYALAQGVDARVPLNTSLVLADHAQSDVLTSLLATSAASPANETFPRRLIVLNAHRQGWADEPVVLLRNGSVLYDSAPEAGDGVPSGMDGFVAAVRFVQIPRLDMLDGYPFAVAGVCGGGGFVLYSHCACRRAPSLGLAC
jgi:hypothetical protein